MKSALVQAVILLSIILIFARSAAMNQGREGTVKSVVQASIDGVVLVVVYDESGRRIGQGSGFIVSSDGRIVTNYHVIEGAHSGIVKLNNGSFFPIDGVLASSDGMLAANKASDLAVIKVSGRNLRHLALGDSEDLSVGDRVVAIGSPLGLQNSVSDGIVSAVREGSHGHEWIQTTVPVSPGNSGGPLLNLAGEVVGVMTLRVQGGENLNFATPINVVKSLVSNARTSVPLHALRARSAVDEVLGKPMTPAAPPLPTPSKEARIEQHVSRAAEFLQKKLYPQAEEECRAAIQLEPSNGDLHLMLGAVFHDQARWHEAIAAYRNAVRLKPNSATAYNNLGVALEAAKGWWFGDMTPTDRQEVLEAYRNGYKLMPHDATTRRNYERFLMRSWPSLVIDPRGPLPISWGDVWRFYVAHWHSWTGGDCRGQLSVGNGRITYQDPGGKHSFDWALSELEEVRTDSPYNLLVLRHKNGKRYRFRAEDRLGDEKPTAPLLDAILQATGR